MGSHPVYAVVRSGGKQYRVEEGALITVASVAGEPGTAVSLGDVLMVADGGDVKSGSDAKVTAEIVSHGKGEKIVVFRYKNKTRSRKKTGARAKSTTLRITGIEV
ncbi:50S ribosomal protein L21 [soil metagenome]